MILIGYGSDIKNDSKRYGSDISNIFHMVVISTLVTTGYGWIWLWYQPVMWLYMDYSWIWYMVVISPMTFDYCIAIKHMETGYGCDTNHSGKWIFCSDIAMCNKTNSVAYPLLTFLYNLFVYFNKWSNDGDI